MKVEIGSRCYEVTSSNFVLWYRSVEKSSGTVVIRRRKVPKFLAYKYPHLNSRKTKKGLWFSEFDMKKTPWVVHTLLMYAESCVLVSAMERMGWEIDEETLESTLDALSPKMSWNEPERIHGLNSLRDLLNIYNNDIFLYTFNTRMGRRPITLHDFKTLQAIRPERFKRITK